MERGSGLTFLENHVNAVVFEGVSQSGAGDRPMYLRASYPADVKKATLVHEHGHRLIAQLRIRPTDLDEHRVLFLFLYDVWESLWGVAGPGPVDRRQLSEHLNRTVTIAALERRRDAP